MNPPKQNSQAEGPNKMLLAWIRARRARKQRIEREANFDKAYSSLLATADELKKAYERTYSTDDAEIRRTLATYKNPEYFRGIVEFVNGWKKTNNPAYAVLHVTSNMFATMVTNVFPPLSRPRSMSFHDWADAYDDSQKQEVVRFALLATISEQKNSGMQDPISVALRVVLFALAANANNDVVSKNLAQELFGIIENSSG